MSIFKIFKSKYDPLIIMENITEQDLNLAGAEVIYKNLPKVEVLLARNSQQKSYIVKKQFINDLNEGNDLLQEAFAMIMLNHDSIIKIHKVLLGGRNGSFEYILLIMDYFQDGDLEKAIKSRQPNQAYWQEESLLNIFNYIDKNNYGRNINYDKTIYSCPHHVVSCFRPLKV